MEPLEANQTCLHGCPLLEPLLVLVLVLLLLLVLVLVLLLLLLV